MPTLTWLRRTRIALTACLGLVACGGAPAPAASTIAPATAAPTPAPGAVAAPPLVVLIVIDQLPAWAFAAKRPALTGGFARLLREGTWVTGHVPSAAAITGPGHALLGTGASPAVSGIIANEWWDRALERVIKATDGEPGPGKDAHRLRVPGLGDSIAAANLATHGSAKAVAVALKDRAALLPLGHAGLAVWYEPKHTAWASSAPRAWLDALATANPIAAHLHDVWAPLDPARLAALSGTIDAQPGEVGEKGFGPTFPHALAATPSPAEAVFAAPVGNQIVLEAALAAIDGEQLGADATPDLLVIGLSAHDYVGHGWGHESWEAWDMTLRLDADLARFLAQLDARAPGWAMIVTSDHGASPLPERLHGGRTSYEQIAAVANQAARGVLGAGTWFAGSKSPYLYLTAAARALPAATRARALDAAVTALRAQPALGRVEPTAPLIGACETRHGDDRAICLMLDAERAGEIVVLPREGWILQEQDEPVATAHGSLSAADRDVPVLLLPPGRVPHAPATAPTGELGLEHIAGTLAGWLGVTPPAALPR